MPCSVCAEVYLGEHGCGKKDHGALKFGWLNSSSALYCWVDYGVITRIAWASFLSFVKWEHSSTAGLLWMRVRKVHVWGALTDANPPPLPRPWEWCHVNPIATRKWAEAHSCTLEYATCCRKIPWCLCEMGLALLRESPVPFCFE